MELLKNISVDPQTPGILALFAFNPQTAPALNALAEVLLRSENLHLSRGEREMIAAHVSYLNKTEFCKESHSAFADYQFIKEGSETRSAMAMKDDGEGLTDRQKHIMTLGYAVAHEKEQVVKEFIDKCLTNKILNEHEVHDTVLIASAFCMYNRYVRSLTDKPNLNSSDYEAIAAHVCENGYGANRD